MDIITPSNKEYVVLDATLLSSLMSCARYYDIRFNSRMVSARGKSNSLEVGTLIHKVFEVFYKHQIDGFPRSTCIGNALTAGMLYVMGCQYCALAIEGPCECGHEPGEYPGVSNTPEDNEPHRNGQSARLGWKFALQTCEQYFEHYKNDSFIPLSAEEVVKTENEPLYEDDEICVGWKAKLDLRIDTNQIGIISMDHKTMKQKRDKTKLSNQFLGHCALLKSRNVMVNKIGLQTSMKIEDRLSRELVSYSYDHIEEWKTEIVPYYAYKYLQFTESGYWPPDYTHCDNIYGACMFKQVCESDRGMREQILRVEYVKAPVWDPQAVKDVE